MQLFYFASAPFYLPISPVNYLLVSSTLSSVYQNKLIIIAANITRVVAKLASIPNSPPVKSVLRLSIVPLISSPVTPIGLPLTFKPSIFPWTKFQAVCHPHAIHRFPVLSVYSDQKNTR